MEQPQFVTFTAKGVRVAWLIEEGKTFDEAVAIADLEYVTDGMTLSNKQPGMEVYF